MSDHATDGSRVDVPEPAEAAASGTVECYDADDGVVFYDAEEPTAWLKTTGAVRLDEWE